MDTKAIMAEALATANTKGQDYLDKYWNGQDHGMCGFAWVTI